MACCMYHAELHRRNSGHYGDFDQCQLSSSELYAAAASWANVASNGWPSGTSNTSPQSLMPLSPMFHQSPAYLGSPNTQYSPQPSYPDSNDLTTINPLHLQVPNNTTKRSGLDSPYISTISGQIGNDVVPDFGFPGSPLELSPDPFTDNLSALPEVSFEAMRSSPFSEQECLDPQFEVASPMHRLNINNSQAPITQNAHTRLTDDQIFTLRNWFYLHINELDAFSDEVEIAKLQEETQLGLEQIQNWFQRSRQRLLSGKTDSSMAATNHPRSRSLSSSNTPHGRDMTSNSASMFAEYSDRQPDDPVQRFQIDAVSNLTTDHHSNSTKGRVHRHRAPTITIDTSHLNPSETELQLNDSHVQTPIGGASPTGLVPDISDAGSEYAMSVVSRRSSVRSLSSYKSARSHQSSHSGSSVGVRGSRRGRRRVSSVSRSPSEASSCRERFEPSDASTMHFCQLCPDAFNRKSTLTRHVKTIHGKEKRPWICSLTELSQCFFCSLLGHFEHCPHRISVCHNKGEDERSFWRKDHFMQHLEGVHKVSKEIVRQFRIDLDQWRAPAVLSVADSDTDTEFSAKRNGR